MIRQLPLNAGSKAIQDAPLDTAFEVLWASRVPLVAAAKTGRIHLTTRDLYPRTLCGLMIPLPSKRFHIGPSDKHCTRCVKKWKDAA